MGVHVPFFFCGIPQQGLNTLSHPFTSLYLSSCFPNGFLFHPVQLVELEEFVAAVKENAEAVEERQETDSIPLVDDIRFHITSNVQTYSAIEEANQKLEALENLLPV